VTVSTVALGLPPGIVNLIQDRTLERVFHDALYPRLLYRSEAIAEEWAANLGERMVFTRAGLMDVDLTPLTPGMDPSLGSYEMEQWECQANQYGKSIDTHMPTNYVALAPIVLRNVVQLGLNAAQAMNRLTRNPLYRAYLGGSSVNILVAAIGATQITVASLDGFTERVSNARILPISPANPLPVTFSNAEPANTAIGFAPLNPAQPFGPGVLTLGAALTVGLPLRTGVFASTRSAITRVGGAATVDGLVGTNILTLQDIINTVARMRAQNVPPTPDGYYHVHVTPEGEAQLFADNQFQRLYQSLPDSAAYRDLAIGQLVGCRFYRNTENPNTDNSGALVDSSGGAGSARIAPDLGGEVLNQAGLAIRRAIVLGGGTIYEKYLDESKFISEAGVTGKIGEFSVVNNGVAIMAQRIRFIMRSPLDRLQQVVSMAWSWSGDFPIPSDGLTGSAARFKRAAIIEHA